MALLTKGAAMIKKKSPNIIVIKVGSSSLTDKSGKLDMKNLKRIAEEISGLKESGKKVILVTSGAIVTGAEKLGLIGKIRTIPQKQAAAAVGQSILMKDYEKTFAEHDIKIGQVLLTRDAIADRERYINARNTFLELLELDVIPIVNENDTVSIDEIKVGDNDNLSALVASLVGADLLIMLTDVEGFFMNDEAGEPKLISEIKEITPEVKNAAGHPSTQMGTGGMITKIQAAEIANDSGIPLKIIHGRKDGLIGKAAKGEKIGTTFIPKISKPESRKRWLAHGLPRTGVIEIDGGAESALTKHGSSLLAVGVTKVHGDFKQGDSISIIDEAGNEVARGLVNYSVEEIKKIQGLKTHQIEEVLGYKASAEIVHRGNLVLME